MQGNILSILKQRINRVGFLPKVFYFTLIFSLLLYTIYSFGLGINLNKYDNRLYTFKKSIYTEAEKIPTNKVWYIQNNNNQKCALESMDDTNIKTDREDEYLWKVRNCETQTIKVAKGDSVDSSAKSSEKIIFNNSTYSIYSYSSNNNDINLLRYSPLLLQPIIKTKVFTPQESKDNISLLNKNFYLDISCNTPSDKNCKLWQIDNDMIEIIYEFKDYDKVNFIKDTNEKYISILVEKGGGRKTVNISLENPNIVDIKDVK